MKWVILLGGLIGSAATAEPTYLSCTVDQGDGKPLAVEIAANEADQQAIVALPSGRVVTRKAIFTPTEVRIFDDESLWTVNRMNLAFQRIVTITTSRSYPGQCQLEKAPPKRAF